jgi:LacI family transcriptional regulator
MKKNGIREVARLANVSISTVDRAFHGRNGVGESTRGRILQIARALGYRPSLAARMLSVGPTLVRIGVAIPREVHFYFDQLRDGLLAEARRFEELGVEVVYRPTERLGMHGVETVSELINCGIQGLIVAPGEPGRLVPIIDEAERRGIRVICVDTDAPGSSRSTVVGVDAKASGRLAAELMGRYLEPGSRVAIVTGTLQVDHHRKKAEGFCELFPQLCEGGSVIDVIEAHDDEDEAFRKSFALLEATESLAGIYVNTGNCLPVCRAIGARELSGKIQLVTTDLFKEMVPYFEKGTIFASINGRPYAQGQIAMRLALDHFVHGRSLPPHYYLAPEVVMRSNLYLLREIRQPQVEMVNSVPSSASNSAPSTHNRQAGPWVRSS